MCEAQHSRRGQPAGDHVSESELQVLLDTIPTLVWRASADGALEYCNRRWLDYTGLAFDEAKGWGWSEAIHPDDRPQLLATWQAILQGGDPADAEARLRGADGSHRWFLFRCVPLRDKDGKITGWCGSNIDIEQRKGIEDDLARSKEILDETQRLTQCGSMGFNVSTGEVFWSAEGARIFGFAPQEHPSVERVWERIHPDDRWLSERSVERARRGEADTEYDVRLIMPDGSIRYVRRKIDPPGGSHSAIGSVCAILDVTETREAEAALHEAQAALAHVTRVTALGELSASIAHEILQPLTAITTTGDASLRWLLRPQPEIEEVRQGLEATIAQAQRASEIVNRIRALARKSQPERLAFDLNRMLDEVLTLIRGEFVRRRVSLRLDFGPALPAVLGDRVQLQQVVINLVVNGIQAMAKLDVPATRVLSLRSRRLGGDQVVVEVEDTGGGIDPVVGDQLFEPFFTTKPEGMGMGLAICRSIVASHSGRLWYTATDAGTIFHVALPAG